MAKVVVLNPPAGKLRFSRDGRCQSEENTWLDTFPPTMLASIAGCVREKYETKLIDCIGARLSLKKCLDLVTNFNPDFVVVNTSTPTIENDIDVASVIKRLTKAKIIMYGEHVTSQYKRLFENYSNVIDFIVRGEPETPVMQILAGKTDAKGVATKDSDNGIWIEPDLDKLPFPAYDLLPVYRYPLTLEPWMFVRSGRGCPYQCIYCVMPMLGARKIRYHSVDYMIKQFQWLAGLNIKLFMLWDEVATFDRERMIELCMKMKESGLAKKCKWFCTTRVDLFDKELASYMKQGGCAMVTFGIESGSQRVLNLNKKGHTLDQVWRAVKAAKSANLKIIGHFILGLLGSNEEDLQKTIDLAKKLKINFAQFYIATPFPGSEFYHIVKENGWVMDSQWKDIEQGSATVSYPDLSAETIQKYKRKAYRSFYLRPYAVYSLLSSMSFKAMVKLPFYLINFFGWMKK